MGLALANINCEACLVYYSDERLICTYVSEFWNMIMKTKDTNKYALYGIYIKNCAKDLGFYDLLNQAIYEPIEFINAKNIILKLQHMDVNPVAKIISQVFHKLSIAPNDLLLSGILDVENIIVRHTLIREELEKINLWKTVDEQIQYIPLDKRLIKFILKVQQNPFVNIQEGKFSNLNSVKIFLFQSHILLIAISLVLF
ncbi:38804_t:CDS:2 [Gigaspora margarita]|uniref:38804_t:CDS:1 n=1 Tax=Gigaspora margarita TaxID=4874 RepID=A0ABN7UIS7_GIGMA|nr:38804_t:CDS:2 [Gigaspora margarita]